MKVKKGFLATSLCALLASLIFVFMASVGPVHASEIETTGVYEEGAADTYHETSQAWAAESEEEYSERGYQEQYREEMSEEGEEGSGYENAPSEEEDESETTESSEEESSPMTPQGDEDLARTQPE